MDFQYFSENGNILPIEEAAVPLTNIAYQYGFGVYENIRVNDGTPYFLKEHVERLEDSARAIELEHRFSPELVTAHVTELIKVLGRGTFNLKLLLIGGKEPSFYILPLNPHFLDRKFYRDGATLITYPYERPFPHAKTLNMLESYLAYRGALRAGAYDALLLNRAGEITEGTRTNFLTVKERTLYSPPEREILLGVMRKVVLHVATLKGFVVEEKSIRPDELSHYDGAFVTSTSSKILPVGAVDTLTLPPIPAALRELMDALEQYFASCNGVLT